MASHRVKWSVRDRAAFALAILTAATLATAIGPNFALAQIVPSVAGPPGIGLPKLTPMPPSIGTIGPTGPVGPTGPAGSGVPTAPRPTGVGGGPSNFTTTFTPTTPTGNPTVTPTGIPTGTPTTTPGAPTTNTGVMPNYNINPRVPDGSAGGAPDSQYSMGSNPNCSSFRNFEGFSGRPCTQRGKRGGAQSTGGGGNAQPPKNAKKNAAQKGVSAALAANDFVPNEIIIEVEGTVTEAQAIALARRHRLTRAESQHFPLIGSTMFRWLIADQRSVETVARQLMAGGGVKSVQHNMRFRTLQAVETAKDDAGQYAIGKLLLTEAHAVTKGEEVRIAVIDSGIDVAHPELAGAIVGTYDALRSTDGPHTHGTGIAGAIAARQRLLGSAPSSRLLAIRAFGATASGAESTSFVVLKGLNYAVEQGAQIINMSFAGPKDPLLERGLAAAAKRGIILIAAAGNAGPKSPPLYPAADRNVIAVGATDSADRLFEASNRGNHLALAAPGVDLLLPAPDEKYQVASGTSFAAAYVSGLAALIVERNPGVAPEVVRRILTDTARDLGPKGKDEQFGYGLANALGAVQAARPVTAGAATRAIELPKATR
jgi:subtilisin family serine protease